MQKFCIKLSLVFFCLSFMMNVKAQNNSFSQSIEIGETVPDITIENIHNYKTTNAKLSDFKGKLLILDFWATWCSPCLAMIPKLDSLQKAFEGKVSFLNVTYQSEKEVIPFLKKFQKQRNTNYNLPEVMGDKVLHSLFPHVTLPHFVWINKSGKVIAITGFKEVNRQTISDALDGETLNLLEKKETRVAYVKTEPLLINGNGGNGSSLLYHSMIASYTEGLSGGYDVFKADSVSGGKIVIRNVALTWFYKVAFREDGYFGENRMVLDVKDSSALVPPATNYTEWIKKNGYCYEIMLPSILSSQIYKIMKEDLRRFFSAYDAVVEKRNIKCLALVRTSSVDKLKSQKGATQTSFNAIGCKINNAFLSLFIGQLNAIYLQKSTMPLIDETGYTGRIDMEINAPLSDVVALNIELAKYDLKFIEVEKEIKMLVIKDRSK